MKDIYELLNLIIDHQDVTVDYLEVTELEKIKVKNELKKILMDNNDSN
ncbi:hypothetical protein ICE_05864 [Bacillus cereus BAG1X1-2]|nr:hypothetical protein [Bacillus cereus]EJS44907.1 hypothetical protein ICE_05864 [Bacillus cereus BAG1X1-2]